MRPGKRMIWVLVGAAGAIAAYIAAWQWDLLPREIIATGTVQLADGKVLKTRQFYRSSRRDAGKSNVPGPIEREAAWEVELLSGRWINCDGAECRAIAEQALR